MKVEVLGFFLRLQGLGFRAQNPHSKGLELVAYYRGLNKQNRVLGIPTSRKNLDPNALALHGWRAAM